MQEIVRMLRADATAFRDRVHTHFLQREPLAHHIFALNMESTHPDFVPALAWFLERCAPDGTPPKAILARAAELGRTHRRHGFPPEIYEVFLDCIMEALNMFPLDALAWEAAERGIVTLVHTLADAARDSTTPPAFQAQVMGITRPNREIAMVRLEMATPLDYQPGQAVPVTSHLLPGKWRWLTPAAPPSPTGQLEFHIQVPSGDGVAYMLSKSHVGDIWTLGQPTNPPLGTNDLRQVYICFGTGWAAARAFLLSDTDPQGAVYAVAASPGHLYDTVLQVNLATLYPRLEMNWMVLAAEDPWLLGADPLDPAAHWQVAANPAAEALHREGITGVRYTIVGPDHRVDQAEHTLLAGGVDPRDIVPIAWAHRRQWLSPATHGEP